MTKKFKEIKNTLTAEQLKAIETAHNKFFCAEMSNNYATTQREKEQALEELKLCFNNLMDFIPDFYDGNDTLVFVGEVA